MSLYIDKYGCSISQSNTFLFLFHCLFTDFIYWKIPKIWRFLFVCFQGYVKICLLIVVAVKSYAGLFTYQSLEDGLKQFWRSFFIRICSFLALIMLLQVAVDFTWNSLDWLTGSTYVTIVVEKLLWEYCCICYFSYFIVRTG